MKLELGLNQALTTSRKNGLEPGPLSFPFPFYHRQSLSIAFSRPMNASLSLWLPNWGTNRAKTAKQSSRYRFPLVLGRIHRCDKHSIVFPYLGYARICPRTHPPTLPDVLPCRVGEPRDDRTWSAAAGALVASLPSTTPLPHSHTHHSSHHVHHHSHQRLEHRLCRKGRRRYCGSLLPRS
jgi:hypothetical protein